MASVGDIFDGAVWGGTTGANASDLNFIEKAKKQAPKDIPTNDHVNRWLDNKEVKAFCAKNRIHTAFLQCAQLGKHPYQTQIMNGDHIGGFWEAIKGGAARKKHVEFARLLQSIK